MSNVEVWKGRKIIRFRDLEQGETFLFCNRSFWQIPSRKISAGKAQFVEAGHYNTRTNPQAKVISLCRR